MSTENDARFAASEIRRIGKASWCVCHPARRVLVWIGNRIYCSNCGPNSWWDNGPARVNPPTLTEED